MQAQVSTKTKAPWDRGSFDAHTIPFAPWRLFLKGGRQRLAVMLWVLVCALAIPAGLMTRWFEWSGVAVAVGGSTLYLTLYIPMLLCVPLVIFYGFWWAAVPAYLSTFVIGVVGGMPLAWIFLFALANPLGLAMFIKLYRSIRIDTTARSISAALAFIIISLGASLAGSTGSFIWTYTNDVGIDRIYPIWQGWWLGGWIQNVLIVMPILWLVGPAVNKWLAPLRTHEPDSSNLRHQSILAIYAALGVLLAYVFAARFFSLRQFETASATISNPDTLVQLSNTIDSLSFPLYVLVLITIALTFFGYRAFSFWHSRMTELNKELAVRNEQLLKLATTDALSGAFNRRKVLELIEIEFVRSRRVGAPFSLLMIDADNFKSINDDYGHVTGDRVIAELANRLKESLREYDVLGRYGGEEFIVMLPQTAIEEAEVAAERICQYVSAKPLKTKSGFISVTISVGIANLHAIDEHYTDIVERADAALYNAKDAGRNCVKADQTMVLELVDLSTSS